MTLKNIKKLYPHSADEEKKQKKKAKKKEAKQKKKAERKAETPEQKKARKSQPKRSISDWVNIAVGVLAVFFEKFANHITDEKWCITEVLL